MAFDCFPGFLDRMVHDSYHVALNGVSKAVRTTPCWLSKPSASENLGTVAHTEPHVIHPCLCESADADGAELELPHHALDDIHDSLHIMPYI
jgi:hypothetical protein